MSTTTGQFPGGVALGVGVGFRGHNCDIGIATDSSELLRALGCTLEDCAIRVRAISLALGAPSGEIGDFISDREGTWTLSTLGQLERRELPFGAVPGAREGICATGGGGGTLSERLERHARFLCGTDRRNAATGGAPDPAGSGGPGDGPDLVSQVEAAKIKIQWLFSAIAGDSPIDSDMFPRED